MSDCRKSRERIARASDGRLPVEEVFELEEHARTCPRCQLELDRSRALEEALQSLPTPPLERMDVVRSIERIHSRLAEGEPLAVPPTRSRRALFVGAAAVLLASLATWLWHRAGDRAETPPIAVGPQVSEPSQPFPVEAEEPRDPIDSLWDSRIAAREKPADPAGVDPVAWTTDFDGDRHAWARGEVARILSDCASAIGEPALLELDEPPGSVATFAVAFERETRPLAAAGWPVLRLVQGLITSEDLLVSRAATRFVGLRGDRGALHELALGLTQEHRKRAAALALADAGSAGLEELRPAFWDPALAPIVFAALERAGRDVALEWTEALFHQARREAASEQRRALAGPLLERVAILGGPVAELLFSLADHPLLDRTTVLDAFARCEGANEHLVQAVRSSRSGVDDPGDELLLGAIARLTPPESFEWVLRRARSAKNPAAALHALACYPGTDAALALLDLRSTGSRADEAAQIEAWRTALELDPVRFEELSADELSIRDPAELRRLLESLVLCEHPSAVPALIALARRSVLADDDRERAVLAAGELGSTQDLPSLAALLAELDGRETRLAAAVVWSAFSLDGAEGVRALLGESEPIVLARLLERLSAPHARSRPTSTLFQLARALEPWLERRDSIAKESR